MRVADLATTITPSVAAQLRGLGFGGAIRYASRVQPFEIANLRSVGLDFGLVHETDGQSGARGFGTGQAEAAFVRDVHSRLGGPPGVILWLGAFDFDYRNPGQAQGYIDGAVSVLHAAGLKAGFYGPAGLGQNTHGHDAWWMTCSTAFWNNAAFWPGATLRQHCDGPWYDSNDVQQPAWGGWFSATPTPQPPPFHPSGGQEDRSKVALVTRPTGKGVDAVVVGADGNVWHASGDSAITLQNAGWENLGSPFGAKSVSGGWTADGSQLVVACHGNDNGMWVKFWDSHLGWTPNWSKQSTGVLAA